MSEISEISGIALGNIAEVNGVTLGNFIEVNGVLRPSLAPSILASGNLGSSVRSGSVTCPVGTDALIVAVANAGTSMSGTTYNSVGMTLDRNENETRCCVGVFSLFSPPVGSSYTLAHSGDARIIYWWAVKGITGVKDKAGDNRDNTSPMSASLDVSNPYSAFGIGSDYFDSNLEFTQSNWNEVYDGAPNSDGYGTATVIIGQYEGAGGTPVSLSMTNGANSSRIVLVSVSYE